MIDKKQLIEDLLECVNDATDTQTAMTGMTMCAILMNEVIDQALILTDVSSMFSAEQMEKAYNDGVEAEQQRCGDFDIENYC